MRPDALAQRVRRNERHELGEERPVLAALEVDLEPILDRRQPQLFEGASLGRRERHVEPVERTAIPQ